MGDQSDYFNYQDYQEDNQVEYDLLSDIFPLQDKKVGGRKKTQVWDYFEEYGEKNMVIVDVYAKHVIGKEPWVELRTGKGQFG
ncbi:unnamed protein product [Rhizophagus irregularis]|nr:unnamed protein product [Rhizophagus irregularis]